MTIKYGFYNQLMVCLVKCFLKMVLEEQMKLLQQKILWQCFQAPQFDSCYKLVIVNGETNSDIFSNTITISVGSGVTLSGLSQMLDQELKKCV